MERLSFLIITTNNLPEAYFLARFLLEKDQQVAIMNVPGRTAAQKARVLCRIGKNRGTLYLVDLLLGKLLRGWYQSVRVVPFPDLTGQVIAAVRERCTYYEARDPHEIRALDFVRTLAPDYILVAGSPVLKQTLTGLARYGALNRHLGLSPGYRGSDCPIWALSQNEPEQIGFTVHRVSEKVDGGEILLQQKVPPEAADAFSEYIAHIQLMASVGYRTVLERIIAGGALAGTAQAAGGKHYPPAGVRAIRRAFKNFGRLRAARQGGGLGHGLQKGPGREGP